ncbi:MAG: bifunctional precorrin-2 dehydrogenase/sirohydrochlorin ferrochelatase [Thermodesulfovibrionia bacterium]
MRYYPVFVRLDGKRVVVVGGGAVAERKAITLIKAGAKVDVISPTITRNLHRYKDKGLIRHIEREYRKGDLKGAFIVIASTSSREVNSAVEREAQGLGCLVNVVDTPSEGNFIAPSIVRRGPLTIAISTEGQSPAISKAIRKEIESLYGKAFSQYLMFAGRIRKEILKRIKDKKQRSGILNLLSSPMIFKILREDGFAHASKIIKRYMKGL